MFKKFISVVGAILLVVTITLTIFTNASPMALLNNYQLNYNLTHPTKDTIFINNVIPFKWDHGYYFSPYVELKDIKKHINVKHFPDKLYNDDQAHIIYVYKGHVEAIVNGLGRSRGYWFYFSLSQVYRFTPKDDLTFTVRKQTNGIYEYVAFFI